MKRRSFSKTIFQTTKKTDAQQVIALDLDKHEGTAYLFQTPELDDRKRGSIKGFFATRKMMALTRWGPYQL